MGFFTTLRTALSLAGRLELVERDVQSLKFEWTDTLDKLLAREERWRKRYKVEVTRSLAPAEESPMGSAPQDAKARLRVLAARRRGQG